MSSNGTGATSSAALSQKVRRIRRAMDECKLPRRSHAYIEVSSGGVIWHVGRRDGKYYLQRAGGNSVYTFSDLDMTTLVFVKGNDRGTETVNDPKTVQKLLELAQLAVRNRRSMKRG